MKTGILEKKDEKVVNNLFNQISEVIVTNKKEMCYQINNTLVNTYFNIVESKQNGLIRAEYEVILYQV